MKMCSGWILTAGEKVSVLITIIICPRLLLLGTFALTVVNGCVDKRGFRLSLRRFNFARKTWTERRLGETKANRVKLLRCGVKKKNNKTLHKSDICHVKISGCSEHSRNHIYHGGRQSYWEMLHRGNNLSHQLKRKPVENPKKDSNSGEGKELCFGWATANWTAHPRNIREWSGWFLFHSYSLKNFV